MESSASVILALAVSHVGFIAYGTKYCCLATIIFLYLAFSEGEIGFIV